MNLTLIMPLFQEQANNTEIDMSHSERYAHVGNSLR